MLSHVQLFANPWTVAHQAPLSIEFPKQEYWSGLAFPPPEDWTLISYIFCIGRWIWFFTTSTTWASHLWRSKTKWKQTKMPSKQVRNNVQHTSFEYETNCHQNLKRTIIPCVVFPSPCQNKGINLYFRMLCGSLDERGVRGKIDTCICMAESLCCLPETLTTSLISYGLFTKPCPTLAPGSSVHRILQARILEWLQYKIKSLKNIF